MVNTESFQNIWNYMKSNISLGWTLLTGNGFSIQYDENFTNGTEPDSESAVNSTVTDFYNSEVYAAYINEHLITIPIDEDIPEIYQKTQMDDDQFRIFYNDYQDKLNSMSYEKKRKNTHYLNILQMERTCGCKLDNCHDIDKTYNIICPAILYVPVIQAHPQNIDQDKALNGALFLKPFLENNGFYTLNYDLLPSWAITTFNKSTKTIQTSIRDGIPTDEEGTFNLSDANIFYCHGAFHLHASPKGCYKINEEHFNKNKTEDDIKQNRLPLLVSDYAANNKLEDIMSNPYLKECYEKLNTIKGNIVTFGLAFSQNDNHIIAALRHAQKIGTLKNIYCGIYIKDEKEFDTAAEEFTERLENKGLSNIICYNSYAINVWEENIDKKFNMK